MNTTEFQRRYGTGMAPPARHLFVNELLTPARLLLDPAQRRRLPRDVDGGGQPVMLLPGFGAGPRSMWMIRRYLRTCGFRTWDWGQGKNDGHVERLTPRIVERLEALVERTGEPFSLVGWSLGGYIAREITRECPALIHRVVTIGSPVVGGPKYTTVARVYEKRGLAMDDVEAATLERYTKPLQRPVRALYSESDGVVAWRACIDRFSDDVEHIRVTGTHLGLGFSKQVLSRLPTLLKD
ncbi:esterase/lipase family protein [Salinisphaera aquimarina]|uniref:Esterase/lipase family protein n=1 Tax=Salinisphaera aquimarina TaxID=2094031 RepID=A0ABV7ENR2_9GAMM